MRKTFKVVREYNFRQATTYGELDVIKVSAIDHEHAVEAFAEDAYYDDPCSPDEYEGVFYVAFESDNSINDFQRFKVTAESSVNFYAEEDNQ